MSLLRGTVTDNMDPLQRGRCRVFVWGMHKEEDPNLPWAETAGSTMFGLSRQIGYSGVLQVGTTVWVQFEQQDIQCPVIVGVFVGHDTDDPGDVSPDNSDFHPDAKGDKYGQVWMFNTPAGNSFKMDDAEPRVHITTPNGFELDLDDKNRRIRLGTPCGPEIVMECDNKLTISSGCAKMTFDGCNIVVDANMQVNGHITAQGVFAPNLCYCNSPGDPHSGSPTSQEKEQKEKQQKCSPTVNPDGSTSCNADYPPNPDTSTLQDKMVQLLDEAKVIYAEKNGGQSLKICESKMALERYQCLISSGVSVPEQMVCGLGVQAVAHDEECSAENPVATGKNPGECGGTFASLEQLKNTIAHGESATSGGYNAYNCGSGCLGIRGRYNFANMSLQEIMSKGSLPSGDRERIFVWGKYQMKTADVTPAAMKWAGLSPATAGSPENQEKMFGYLITNKRTAVLNYLTGSGSLDSALVAIAMEWASVGVPRDMQGASTAVKKNDSYYSGVGGNKALTKSEDVAAALQALKQDVDAIASSKSMNKQQALINCILGRG